MVGKEGECGFLDACGEPEPMKVNHLVIIIITAVIMIITVVIIIITVVIIIIVIIFQSEIMASRDCYEMKRLDYGKVFLLPKDAN